MFNDGCAYTNLLFPHTFTKFIKARITEHEAETSNFFGGGVVKILQKEKKKKKTFCHKFPV
jgi:hypothetical protein